METAEMEFFNGLSVAEWDLAEGVAYIAHALCKGLTEEKERLFLRAAIEKARERADLNGPAVELLNAGLLAIGKPLLVPGKRKRRVRGVY